MRGFTWAAVMLMFVIGCNRATGPGKSSTVHTLPNGQHIDMKPRDLSGARELPPGKTMVQCLDGDRPDMAVSLWLQKQTARVKLSELPPEVANAFLADQFLREVNSGGFLGLFDWCFEDVAATIEAMKAIGLVDVASSLKTAMRMVEPGEWPKSKDDYKRDRNILLEDAKRSAAMDGLDHQVIDQSLLIERATHAYVRKHIAVFTTLDR